TDTKTHKLATETLSPSQHHCGDIAGKIALRKSVVTFVPVPATRGRRHSTFQTRRVPPTQRRIGRIPKFLQSQSPRSGLSSNATGPINSKTEQLCDPTSSQSTSV